MNGLWAMRTCTQQTLHGPPRYRELFVYSMRPGQVCELHAIGAATDVHHKFCLVVASIKPLSNGIAKNANFDYLAVCMLRC